MRTWQSSWVPMGVITPAHPTGILHPATQTPFKANTKKKKERGPCVRRGVRSAALRCPCGVLAVSLRCPCGAERHPYGARSIAPARPRRRVVSMRSPVLTGRAAHPLWRRAWGNRALIEDVAAVRLPEKRACNHLLAPGWRVQRPPRAGG